MLEGTVHGVYELSQKSTELYEGVRGKLKKFFNAKKEFYKKADLTSFKNITSDNGAERDLWDKDAIDSRRDQLIKFAMEQWKDL